MKYCKEENESLDHDWKGRSRSLGRDGVFRNRRQDCVDLKQVSIMQPSLIYCHPFFVKTMKIHG